MRDGQGGSTNKERGTMLFEEDGEMTVKEMEWTILDFSTCVCVCVVYVWWWCRGEGGLG